MTARTTRNNANYINYQVYDGATDIIQDHTTTPNKYQQHSQEGTSSGRHNIQLVPTLSIGLDSMCIGVIAVSVIGLLGVARGNRRLMNLYFGFVMLFISIQVLFAVKGFLSGEDWVRDALDRSWTNAYETDPDLIRDLQYEFNCKGFHDADDRSLETTTDKEETLYNGQLPNCGDILQSNFGSRLERLGTMILCIRLIQLAGVFLLSILFKYLTILDQADYDQDELESQQSSENVHKAGYYLTEKQLADADAYVPLLLSQEAEEEEEEEERARREWYAGDDSDCDDASVVLSDDGSQITVVVGERL
ncbi:hypothetical protein FBU30_005775 [Linnemannia zychae]|nr:hypothetical protein FBU30_005775 [Linnemannia zychae]